MFLIATYKMI